MRNYTRDGDGLSEAALQEEASNHSKLRWSKASVVSVREKVSYKTSGENQGDEAIKPLLRCRKYKDEIKTKGKSLTWEEFGRNLITGQAVSGMKVA